MKVCFHFRTEARHQQAAAEWLRAGLKRHGIEPAIAPWGQPAGADVAVMWSWKQPAVIEDAKRRGARVLVLERGYLPDRMQWISAGFDGMNGRATHPEPQDWGERFHLHFGRHLKPWAHEGGMPAGSLALLIDQVPNDAQLMGVDIRRWLDEQGVQLRAMGWRVRFRPHPVTVERRHVPPLPAGAHEMSRQPLDQDLAEAGLVVTFNSNTGVEAVLAGRPTIVMDRGGMAWPVAGHDLAVPPPVDRADWCRRLAWCQWSPAEIEDGTAWEALRTCV